MVIIIICFANIMRRQRLRRAGMMSAICFVFSSLFFSKYGQLERPEKGEHRIGRHLMSALPQGGGSFPARNVTGGEADELRARPPPGGSPGATASVLLLDPKADGLQVLAPDVEDINETVLSTNVSLDHLKNCTEPAYLEFPPDLVGRQLRSQGLVVVHFLVTLYMFLALAVVCDEYFVSSLEKICERLGFTEDVAGATFMAAGSSAPELFTSVIGVFIAKGDVGTGTIVGSAVFNILFITGICGIMAPEVRLTWWPLFRDSVFYLISVVTLILIILDSEVTWYESLIMLFLYMCYICIMKFNKNIVRYIAKKQGVKTEDIDEGVAEEDLANGGGVDGVAIDEARDNPMLQDGAVAAHTAARADTQDGGAAAHTALEADLPQRNGSSSVIMVDEEIKRQYALRKLSFQDASLRIMISKECSPRTRLRSACKIIIIEKKRLIAKQHRLAMKAERRYHQLSFESDTSSYTKAIHGCPANEEEEEEAYDGWKRPPGLEEGAFEFIKWLLAWPIYALMYITVPDCRKERWHSFYMATFFISILWIGVLSYIMVWMVTIIGFTLGIPDSIMGITFLAAGTSIPDAIASLLVAKQGLGDMAISNSIGSNVFDILLGLGFPWFLDTAIIEFGATVHINSTGLKYSVVLLFLTVAITFLAIHCFGWKLSKKLGWLCMSVYLVFLAFSILIEYNVFGYVNPPMCTG